MKKIGILLFLIFSLTYFGFSQDIVKSTKIEKVNGIDFYMHNVVKGQTVYAISKVYNVTTDEIYIDNPEAKKGISENTILKIKVPKSEIKFIDHTVMAKETLFTIAKQYNVKVDDIKAANSGLTEAIKPGQIIKIPSKQTQEKLKEIPALEGKFKVHEVIKGETLFGIAKQYSLSVDDIKKANPSIKDNIALGMELIIPNSPIAVKVVETEKIAIKEIALTDCNNLKKLNEYNIAFMIPFYLENSYEIDSTSDDDKKAVYNYKPFYFIQFYEGVLLAIDSLKQLGINAKIYVYDVTDDTSKIASILTKPEMKKMNLIIGPFFASSFNKVAKWAKQNQVYIVNPFSSKSENINENEYAFKIALDDDLQIDMLMTYLKKEYADDNVVLIYNGDPESEIIKKHKLYYYKHFDKNLTEINFYKDGGVEGVSKKLNEKKINIILSLASGEAFVSNYIRSIRDLPVKYKVILFGGHNWEGYTSLELLYLLNLNYHTFSNIFIDYSRPDVQNFVLKFRGNYQLEPDTMAFQGFDFTLYFANALNNYGKDFIQCLSNYKPSSLSSSYYFRQSENGGNENIFLNIYRFNNYKEINAIDNPLKEIELIVKPEPPPKKPNK